MGSTLQKPLIVAALAAVCLIVTTAAEARGGRGGFSGGRSFSRPSVTRVAPRPQAPKTIVKKNTTIINQSHTTNAAPASSGGFWSNLFGTTAGVVAGSAIYNALTDDDKDKQAAPQQAAPVEDKEEAK